MEAKRYQALRAIVIAGVLAGSVDIGAASLINMLSPLAIMRAIASGLIGDAAHGGGLPVALLGLLLQWGMGMIIAAIYMLATSRIPGMRRRWIPTGLLAGVIIYFVMTYVVLPLSAAPFRQPFDLQMFIKNFALDAGFAENMVAMLVFGLIVAYVGKGASKALPAAAAVTRSAH